MHKALMITIALGLAGCAHSQPPPPQAPQTTSATIIVHRNRPRPVAPDADPYDTGGATPSDAYVYPISPYGMANPLWGGGQTPFADPR